MLLPRIGPNLTFGVPYAWTGLWLAVLHSRNVVFAVVGQINLKLIYCLLVRVFEVFKQFYCKVFLEIKSVFKPKEFSLATSKCFRISD